MDTDKLIRKITKVKSGDNVPFIGRKKIDRVGMAKMFGELGFKIGAEIGVRKGDFSVHLLDAVGEDGVMTFIDPWEAWDSGTGEKFSSESAERCYRTACDRISKYRAKSFIKRMKGCDALDEVPDESLDFVYIDAGHSFDDAIIDIINWSKKVRPGGVVSGHDYYISYNFGVIEAVNAYTRCHNINNWYITSERVPSWFWVKK